MKLEASTGIVPSCQRCSAMFGILPQPAHHSEACTVDNREILIAIGHPDLPGSFQVRYAD